MSRGRPPEGPALVDRIDGSELARDRAKVVLETIAGKRTIEEACEVLGIGKTAFHDLRKRALEAAVAELEPKPPGRPARPSSELQTELDAKRQEVDDLLLELEVAYVREELALVMPEVLEENRRKKKGPSPQASKRRRKTGRRRRRK